MASYTDDELIEAMRAQMRRDSNFRAEVEQAVSSRWQVRLRQLIAGIAEAFFGRLVGGIVDTILGWFLN